MKLAVLATVFVITLVALVGMAYRHEIGWVAGLFPLALLWFALAATRGE